MPDTGCGLGHVDRSKCPAWTGQVGQHADAADLVDEMLLPWSGSALGLADLGFIAGRARPLVIGVIGAQNAGKTTMLAAWYLLLGCGAADDEQRPFAGSFSLAGWEAIAGLLRWNPGQPPSFPPHTTSRSGRAPGLLHLSFRDAERTRFTDYLLADSPGEWFQRWAINRDAADAAGARWIAAHADVFLLVADREALSGEYMGTARNNLRLLAGRLAAERKERPVALVWTKSDIEIAPQMEQSIRAVVFDRMPDAAEFSVSVKTSQPDKIKPDKIKPGADFIELLNWALSTQRARARLPARAAAPHDQLFLYAVSPA